MAGLQSSPAAAADGRRAAWIGRVSAILLAAMAMAPAHAAKPPELAITFDDLPAHSALPDGETRVDIARRIIAALKAAGVANVYGFINAVQIEREPASEPVLKMWRDAGFPLGNHTWSHLNLDTATADAFNSEVAQNEPVLRKLAGNTDWHWLRYPNLVEGSDPAKRLAVRHYLAAHGYRIAGVTMSFGDYAFNEPFARCVARKDEATIAQMEQDYLAAAQGEIARARSMSQALYGRDIPYVLLMHVGAFDARMLPRLLALYKQAGFHFVTLPQAEKDPAYREEMDPALPSRPGRLEGRMAARGLTAPKGAFNLASLGTLCR
jgi:peptidoglycan/xylan/chitin deacetylase (PgdA/CDA1 family)